MKVTFYKFCQKVSWFFDENLIECKHYEDILNEV